MADMYIDMNIEDALIEKPHCFTIEAEDIGERHFYLFPITLGKQYLLKRHMERLNINLDNIKKQPFLEALRIIEKNRKEVCRILTYHTFKKKRDLFDYELIEQRTEFFLKHLNDEELATLVLLLLTKDDIEGYKKHLGISKEQERLRLVSEWKKKCQKGQNDFNFGCKSVYGSLLDTACERYGWSYDYVLWGISLTNLQLLLADRMQNIFLSDDEKKNIPSRLLNSSDTINADDKANQEKILSMNWR